MTASQQALSCFKAYDVRGRVPDQLNESIADRIGRAFAAVVRPRRVVVGHDIRLSSPAIHSALVQGLRAAGVDVFDIGLCGTEEIYFATAFGDMDGGIVVTASHNPKDYNGMKFVRAGARPVSGDTGLKDIQRLTEAGQFDDAECPGRLESFSVESDYVRHLLAQVDRAVLGSLKILVNPGNGGAGRVIDRLEPELPFRFVRLQHEPDGRFPNGVPNPLLEENRSVTRDAVLETGADMGIAWDGDFDRCFFFDHEGRFVEGYYLVGLLADAYLRNNPGQRVVHDPRLTWNTREIVEGRQGIPVQCKTGHAFIKERMRAENAIYGGEMSAHHYFRDFYFCDSGMIPWLKVAELMCRDGKRLADLVAERQAAFPCSGEINRAIDDPDAAIKAVVQRYRDQAESIDHTDGVSMEFADWRFNLRLSNTEAVVRLNVESRGDRGLMQQKTAAILEMLAPR